MLIQIQTCVWLVEVRLFNLVYRDIKERGRNLNNVIARYHKFVKPAFDEYIGPTRKMADVIIPRGAENTVAIDLVAQHLKYQLTKMFTEKNLNIGKPINTIELFRHDIIDPKFQFFAEKINVPQDETQIEVLQHIFQDFLNGYNMTYYKLFLEQMLSYLLTLFSETVKFVPQSGDLVITETDNISEIDISQKKRIVYFQTCMLTERDFDNLK